RAAAIFRVLTALTLSEAARLNREIDLVLAVDPRGDLRRWGHVWPQSFRRIAQVDGSLGRRLNAAIASIDRGPVVVIGADAPGMRAGNLRAAFRALGAADAVFGPAEDGGFWLIGIARRKRALNLFANVRWSTRHALADTVKSLPAAFSVARLGKLRDIDEAKDLKACGPILRSIRSGR
ncbi:MAG: DUF2064 domain-containing protein, partial [Parvularculaceae bacterium]